MGLALAGVALLVELMVGYPDALFRRVGHPVSWIGALIAKLDQSWNSEAMSARARRREGVVAVAVVLALVCGGALMVQILSIMVLPRLAATLVLGILASSCLAQRSLDAHVRIVADALDRDGLPAARYAVSRIVGRDTLALDEAGVARAAIESLAENFGDGIVAPACWIALAGLPGGLVYKAVNTADSMIGHRTPRHEAFGFAAAKLDDVLNWLPARLAALWIVTAAALTPGASAHQAWRVMWRDARGHASPNAGWPEAAMAGALGVTLGGSRLYAGRLVEDAAMGDGTTIMVGQTIRHALRLYRIACGLQIATTFACLARWLAL